MAFVSVVPVRINYERLEQDTEAFLARRFASDGTGQVDEALERELFQPRGSGAGSSLGALELEAFAEGPGRVDPVHRFSEANLHPLIQENLAKCGYERPTIIQGYCIPNILAGKDIVAVAQTGSGKTAAYLAPVISALIDRVDNIRGPRADTRAAGYHPDTHKVRAEPLVLIVGPTRELALQIFEEVRRISYRTGMRAACAYGGIPVKYGLQQLGKGCDVLIGTPGRLKDMLNRPGVLSLQRVKFTIVDEADEMLQDSQFEEALNNIIASGSANEDADHRYLMFSATFPRAARDMASQYLQEDHLIITIGRAGSTHSNVEQSVVYVERDSKDLATFDLLNAMKPGRVLIFCNSVPTVDRVDDYLFNKGMPVNFLHRNRSQFEREDALRDFASKKSPILVTTAVTARGIDFFGVDLVLNYDLPSQDHGGIAEYVHRIGRTGRIGNLGKSISFYNDRDEGLAEDLVNILLETNQEVPDFLTQFKPQDGQARFDDEGRAIAGEAQDGSAEDDSGAAAWAPGAGEEMDEGVTGNGDTNGHGTNGHDAANGASEEPAPWSPGNIGAGHGW